MKVFALTILAVVGCVLADSNELSSSEERFFRELTNYRGSAKEYVSNSLKDVAEAICEDKTTDLKGPLDEVVKRAEEIDTASETVCGLIKNHLVYVVDPMAKAIDGCLPNEDAGIAQYGVKAVAGVVSYLCQLNGEHILELVNPCIEDLDLENSKCIENVESKWNEVTTTSGKSFKEEACSEFGEVRPCFVTEINSKCKLQITRDSLLGILDSVFKTPCA